MALSPHDLSPDPRIQVISTSYYYTNNELQPVISCFMSYFTILHKGVWKSVLTDYGALMDANIVSFGPF